ncbi:MAG: hypothetical protein AUI15_09110 [Actinobacteria bacterium 13_2_20CM_2_66_6]|nr:MAG: hypothetical protein AUI15_09110 [Actinobacteria bacterium 13_2_20CM_2_66_6]
MLDRALDACSELVALFTKLIRLGPRRRELVAKSLDLVLQLADAWVGPAGIGLGVGEIELETFHGDLQLASFREQILDERLRRPGLLF